MRKHIPISEKLAQTHGVMMFSLEIDSIGLDLVDIYCFDILLDGLQYCFLGHRK